MAHRKQKVQSPPKMSPWIRTLCSKYPPREAVLRMQQDLESGNSQMWDLTANRVLDDKRPHCKTGNEWKILYDFTHCLCDALKASRTHYVPPNLSFPVFRMSGFVTNLVFTSQCKESTYFTSVFAATRRDSHGSKCPYTKDSCIQYRSLENLT
jgi:hypothetical protein